MMSRHRMAKPVACPKAPTNFGGGGGGGGGSAASGSALSSPILSPTPSVATPTSPSVQPRQPGRAPKAVACPKAPATFGGAGAGGSALGSPLKSPTPSVQTPSSPFGLRKASFSSLFRRGSNATTPVPPDVVESLDDEPTDDAKSDGNDDVFPRHFGAIFLVFTELYRRLT